MCNTNLWNCLCLFDCLCFVLLVNLRSVRLLKNRDFVIVFVTKMKFYFGVPRIHCGCYNTLHCIRYGVVFSFYLVFDDYCRRLGLKNILFPSFYSICSILSSLIHPQIVDLEIPRCPNLKSFLANIATQVIITKNGWYIKICCLYSAIIETALETSPHFHQTMGIANSRNYLGNKTGGTFLIWD